MKNIKIVVSSSPATNNYYLSAINWFLKLYHSRFSESKNDFYWTPPISLFYEHDNYSKLESAVLNENIDILAFSMYVWNRDIVLDVSRRLKEKYKNITIVLGGPDVDAHRDKDFFKKYPFVDWVIYGDGEVAFTRLLDHISGYNPELINLVSPYALYRHEVFNDKSALKLSPYLIYKDEIIAFILDINSNLENIQNSKNLINQIMIVWETTKGCPYACSFCDWSSGLHNKVRIWGKGESIPNWQKEIDFFFELKVTFNLKNMYVYWTNPNVGLTPQDDFIVEYWCKKMANCVGPKIFNPQLSKLKKDNAFRLLDMMLDAGVTEFFKFDLQDLDPVVLENIDRPEIPWPEHKKLITDLKFKYKDRGIVTNRYSNRITFMWGLPGQTIFHMKHNMMEAGTLESFASHLPFEILPNTPAATDEYIEKYKLQISPISILGHGKSYSDAIADTRVIHRAVVGNYSLSNRDWFTGMVLFYIYNTFLIDYNLYGIEYLLFDNYYKISSVIDESYEKFEETGIVAVTYGGVPLPISSYVNNNKEALYNILYN